MKTLKGFIAMIGMILGMILIIAIILTMANLGACAEGSSCYDNSIYMLLKQIPWYAWVGVIGLVLYTCFYSKYNPGRLNDALSKMLFPPKKVRF